MPLLSKIKRNSILVDFLYRLTGAHFDVHEEITPLSFQANIPLKDLVVYSTNPLLSTETLVENLSVLLELLKEHKAVLIDVGYSSHCRSKCRWLDDHLSCLYYSSWHYPNILLGDKKLPPIPDSSVHDEHVAARIKSLRAKVLDIKLSVLSALVGYLKDNKQTHERLLKRIHAIFVKNLDYHDMKFLFKIDASCYGTHYKYHRRFASEHSSGGISDLLFVISYVVVEKETKQTFILQTMLGDLINQPWNESLLDDETQRGRIDKAHRAFTQITPSIRALNTKIRRSFYKTYRTEFKVTFTIPHRLIGKFRLLLRERPIMRPVIHDTRLAGILRAYSFDDDMLCVKINGEPVPYKITLTRYWCLRLLYDQHKKKVLFVPHRRLVDILSRKLASLGITPGPKQIRDLFKASKVQELLSHDHKGSYYLTPFPSR